MMFRPIDPSGSIRVSADELATRCRAGELFRLVAILTGLDVTFAEKDGGRWPLLVPSATGYPTDPGPVEVVITTTVTHQRGESYSARPKDPVVVIPVPPAEAEAEAVLGRTIPEVVR